MKSNTEKLTDLCESLIHSDFNLNTRISEIRIISERYNRIYLKRDDELSSGIAGSKYRKYASLIKYITKNDFKMVYTSGSLFSNHLTGIVQLFREFSIDFRILVPYADKGAFKGNRILLDILTTDDEIIFFESIEKHDSFIENLNTEESLYIGEGGVHPQAIAGMLSLSAEILQSEQTKNYVYENIFIDAGTSFSAAVTAAGLSTSENKHRLFVVDNPGDHNVFNNFYSRSQNFLRENNIEIYDTCSTFFLKPVSAASFGSVNRTVLEFIRSFARLNGILLEPVYTAKTLMTGAEYIRATNTGNVLFIHSGSATALSGFLDRF